VNLTQCPYDGAQVEVALSDRGSLLLTCVCCEAVWERHGGWTGRVRGPNPEKVTAARRRNPANAAAEPLPMVRADLEAS
jgi:hypothetical protein